MARIKAKRLTAQRQEAYAQNVATTDRISQGAKKLSSIKPYLSKIEQIGKDTVSNALAVFQARAMIRKKDASRKDYDRAISGLKFVAKSLQVDDYEVPSFNDYYSGTVNEIMVGKTAYSMSTLGDFGYIDQIDDYMKLGNALLNAYGKAVTGGGAPGEDNTIATSEINVDIRDGLNNLSTNLEIVASEPDPAEEDYNWTGWGSFTSAKERGYKGTYESWLDSMEIDILSKLDKNTTTELEEEEAEFEEEKRVSEGPYSRIQWNFRDMSGDIILAGTKTSPSIRAAEASSATVFLDEMMASWGKEGPNTGEGFDKKAIASFVAGMRVLGQLYEIPALAAMQLKGRQGSKEWTTDAMSAYGDLYEAWETKVGSRSQ